MATVPSISLLYFIVSALLSVPVVSHFRREPSVRAPIRNQTNDTNISTKAWMGTFAKDKFADIFDEANESGVSLDDLLLARNDGAAPTHKMPVIWAHVQKAGGTLLCEIAQGQGEKVENADRNCNTNMLGFDSRSKPADLPNAQNCSEWRNFFEKHGYSYAQIEYQAFEDSYICEGFHYGVMLREPFSLSLSAVTYSQNMDHTDHHTVIECMRRGEFCDSGDSAQNLLARRLDNLHIRHLLSHEVMYLAPGSITDDHANRAIAKIENHFDVVTILEEMDRNTPDILNRAFGWSVPSGNIAKSNPTVHISFTSEDESFIRELNVHDLQVYNHFKAKPPSQRGMSRQLD